MLHCINASKRCWWNGKQRRPWSDCFFRSSLILVCTVCWDLSVPIHRICTVLQKFLLRENGLTWRCLGPLFLTLGLGWGRDHNGHHTHEPNTVNQCNYFSTPTRINTEKRKYVARPGIETGTSGLWVRRATDCATLRVVSPRFRCQLEWVLSMAVVSYWRT